MKQRQRVPAWMAVVAVGVAITWAAGIGWLVISIDTSDAETLDRELADMTMETTALLTQLDHLSAEREELRAERDRLRDQVSALEDELADAISALDASRAALDRSSDEDEADDEATLDATTTDP